MLKIPRQLFRNQSEIRLPSVEPSAASAGELFAIYRESLSVWRKWFESMVLPAYEQPPEVIVDAITRDASGSDLGWLVQQAERAAESRVLYQTQKLGQWVTRSGIGNATKTVRVIKNATGTNVQVYMTVGEVRPILEAAVRENVSLIKGLNADLRRKAEQIIFDGIANRRSKAYIAKQLRDSLQISLKRAKRISADQSQKLNTALNRYRAQQIGATYYIWRTMLDKRVRQSHRKREGKRFRWDKPPEDGHPGHPINCRCRAESIIDPPKKPRKRKPKK